MKNILIAIDSLVGGGAEKVLKDILENIDKSKYNIEILLINREGVYLNDIEKNYVVKSLNKSSSVDSNIILRKIKTFFRLIKINFMTSRFWADRVIDNKYDIEIAFLEGQCTKLISNRKNKSKKIAWVHIDLEKHRTLPSYIEKRAYNKFNKIIAVSKDSANSISKLYPICKDRIQVLYNPIDSNKIRNMAKEGQLDYQKSTINLVTVGRLDYQKGYDILLKSHKELIDEGYIHKLYIIGEGKEYDNFNKYIKKNNLSNSVKLLGFKNNPYPYIYDADAYVMSSRYEGLPLVIGETLVLGTPIIATKCTGPLEMLDHGKYGIMVECENVESLKSGIKKMIVSKQTMERYSNLSIERSKIFNIKNTMNEIEYLLDTV